MQLINRNSGFKLLLVCAGAKSKYLPILMKHWPARVERNVGR